MTQEYAEWLHRDPNFMPPPAAQEAPAEPEEPVPQHPVPLQAEPEPEEAAAAKKEAKLTLTLPLPLTETLVFQAAVYLQQTFTLVLMSH